MTKSHYGILCPERKIDCISLTDVAKDFVAGHKSRLSHFGRLD